MKRLTEITPVFVEQSPELKDMEEGKLYITEERGFAIHLCACGCGQQTVCDLKPHWNDGWDLIKYADGKVSLQPSIGNFNGQNPYHAHYFITENKIVWV